MIIPIKNLFFTFNFLLVFIINYWNVNLLKTFSLLLADKTIELPIVIYCRRQLYKEWGGGNENK